MNDKTKLAFDNPEFMFSREARMLRIASEYIEPDTRMKKLNINHTVVFFGSARLKPESSEYYTAAEEFAYRLAQLSLKMEKDMGQKFYITTGGGPGIMEAANKGASRAGLPTIGLNIDLPFEQEPNPYITPELNFDFHYFFMRKLWFLYQAKAIVIFPGGFGTLDEFFETITLIQTRKLEKTGIPVLLYDSEFWNDLINFPKLVDYGLISPEDLDLFHFFNDIDEGIDILEPKLKLAMQNIRHYFGKTRDI